MEYSLDGQEIARICLDFAVVLETIDGTELRIESQFRLVSSSGTTSTDVDPERIKGAGEVVVGLLHQEIALAKIEQSGKLMLAFADGQRLECEPSDEFEAWTLVTAAGERMVCLPGGGLAHWPRGDQ